MEMTAERKLQRRKSSVTETRGSSGKDEMNLLGELPSISLAAGKIGKEAIIVELLLALPIKSLIRFKCMCKSWCSLISNPQFGRSHLNRSMLQNPNSSQKLVFQVTDPTDGRFTMKTLDCERYNFEAFDIADDKLNCLVRLRLPITQPRNCTIFGTCDGLVCFLALYSDLRRIIVIRNPTTGAFKEIQPPAANFKMLGFGYDHANSDYKIVISIPSRLQEKSNNVLVFALKGESWRVVCQMCIMSRTFGVYLNGCLHWLPFDLQLDATVSILSFDLSKEKFERVIPLPDIYTDIYSTLVVLRGCLCLYSLRLFCNKCYIMVEYGLKSSWTEFQLPEFNRDNASYPLCIRTDGKVFGVLTRSSTSDGFYLYSVEDNSCKIASIGDVVISNPCVYVESLVSP